MTLLILILIILSGIVGFRRGGLLQLLHFLGTVSALVIARLNYETLGNKLELIMPYPSSVSEVENVVLPTIQDLEQAYYYMSAFLFIFIVSKLIIQIIVSVFDFVNQIIFERKRSKIIGTIIGVIECIYVLAVIIFFLATIPSTGLQEAISNSQLATFIMDHTLIISDKLKDWSQI